MGAKKVKSAKKPLKTTILPQETFAEQVKEWVDAHYAYIVGTLALIVFVFLATWGVRAYQTSRQERAQADYAAIASKLPADGTQSAWEQLIPDLQKFVADHKGTSAGLNAQVTLAKALFQAKRYDESIKIASDALGKAPEGLGIKPLIRYQLAYAYEAAGKQDQAAAEWENLKTSALPGIDREAYWNLGRIYAGKKDYAKAVEMFEKAAQAQGTYPTSAFIDQALASAKSSMGTGAQAAK